MSVRVAPRWLELREPADAAARSVELAERLADHLTGPLVVHDLGAGSGAMGRWLAPLLPGPQHWVLHDLDADLLQLALARPPAGVSVQAQLTDVARLVPDDLAGAGLIVASALLDLLTTDELETIVAVWNGRCPLLLTLTVMGRVTLDPPDPLDARVEAAFNANQRRGRLLGPDAVPAAVEQLRNAIVWPSPWHLGAADAELTAEWFRGWVDAACEQDRTLDAAVYRAWRLGQAAAGELEVTVDHADLLVLP